MLPEFRAKKILWLAADMELAQGDGKVDQEFWAATLRWIKKRYDEDVSDAAHRLIAEGYNGEKP